MALTVRACSRCGLAGHYAPRCPERYATVLPAPGVGRQPATNEVPKSEPIQTCTDACLGQDFARLSAEYAAACERLAEAWPGQRIGEGGYTDAGRTATHLGIIAKSVRKLAERVTKGANG